MSGRGGVDPTITCGTTRAAALRMAALAPAVRVEAVMRLVIFGLTVSSSWGNGHATLWRSLISGLDAAGHDVVFFERDVPHYRSHRDLRALSGHARLCLYRTWADVEALARTACVGAGAAIVTSYCPDARAASAMVLASRARVRIFYDLDTPVTLARLDAGEDVPYVPVGGLGEFDLVLSYTGGGALVALQRRLGARRVVPLYGSVDPVQHRVTAANPGWAAACSYLGTWSADRQTALEMLLLEPSRQRGFHIVLGGAPGPSDIAWPANRTCVDHVPTPRHAAFYCSSPVTVNVTRAPMAALGFCPSGRLFEAAACGVPVLSDRWFGIETFFAPGEEILIAATTDEAVAAIDRDRDALASIGRRARARAIADHSGKRRAAQLIASIESGDR